MTDRGLFLSFFLLPWGGPLQNPILPQGITKHMSEGGPHRANGPSWMSKSCKSRRGYLRGRNKNGEGRVMWCECGRKCSNEVKHISPAGCVWSACPWLVCDATETQTQDFLPVLVSQPWASLFVSTRAHVPLCKLILYHPHSKSWADKPAWRWQKKRITSLPCSRLNNKWSFVPCVCVHQQIEWKPLRPCLNKHSGFLKNNPVPQSWQLPINKCQTVSVLLLHILLYLLNLPITIQVEGGKLRLEFFFFLMAGTHILTKQ